MPQEMHTLEDIASSLASRESNRPLYTFVVPKGIAATTGIGTIGLVELTTGELMSAQARGGDNRMAMGFELAKESWRRANERKLSTADGSVDALWGDMGAGMSKLRTLVTQAYADIHNPKPDEAEAFLASRSVSV